MFNYIEKIRGKSDKEKKRLAFLFSFLFVGIIFVVWISVVLPDLKKDNEVANKVANQNSSPFSTFASIISQSSSAMSEQISKIKNLGASFYSGADYTSFSSTTTLPVSTEIEQNLQEASTTTIENNP